MRRKVYIIEAKRTAIGKFLGSFYEVDPVNVCVQLIQKGFTEKYLSDIQCVVVGNVISAGLGQGLARNIAVRAIPDGKGIKVPAYSVNMVCGSGMQAVINASNEIRLGKDLVLAGGVEFMSNIPYATDSYIRLGKKFGDFTMIDLMTHDGLTDSFSGVHMGITAENIAKQLKISRQEQDEYAYLAQQRAINAVDHKKFANEIVPIALRDYKGREYVFDTDEFPNRNCTLEKLSTLKTSFIKGEGGTVTAGNSSGINDGASFLLVASEEYCDKNGIIPLCELVDGVAVGCDPQTMGLGPNYAIQELISKNEVDFSDVNFFEVNEAFAAQALGVYKLLAEQYHVTQKSIIDKCNIWGSGLGLGHPLGATGARIITTLTSILSENNAKYGIASLCIGGGMGAAVLLKR